MTERAIRIDIHREFEVIELDDSPHLETIIGGFPEIMLLNGPIGMHLKAVTAGLAIDEDGHLKGLRPNPLACSLWGVFGMASVPIVGTVVVMAGDIEGKPVDVPDWTIELLTIIKKSTDEAMKYHQDRNMN